MEGSGAGGDLRRSPSGNTPLGEALIRHLERKELTQEAFASEMRAAGYKGRKGGFDQRTVSYVMKTENVALPPSFFNCAKRVLDLDDAQMDGLWRAYLASSA